MLVLSEAVLVLVIVIEGNALDCDYDYEHEHEHESRLSVTSCKNSLLKAAKPRQRSATAALRQDVMHDMPRHVGEAEVAALVTVGQAAMIDAEQMQHRGVEVVHVDFVFNGRVA